MINRIFLCTLVTVLFALLQSVLFSEIMPAGVVPDFVLVILLVASWRYGSMLGIIIGFISGLCLDITGLAPLGFHAFLFTLIGYIFGLLHGTLSADPLPSKLLATLIATILKYGGASILAFIFGINSNLTHYFRWITLFEIVFNLIITLPLFYLFFLVSRKLEGRKGGF